ncbi:MAG: DUF6600 domain-containing protein, partial [Blastocatellia bacterium]
MFFAITPDFFPVGLRRLGLIVTSLVALCVFVNARAQAQDRVTRIARISLIEGEVSYQRANDSKKDWFEATPNLPLDESDQLYTGANGRAEIQLSGRNVVRISRDTNLRFTQFTAGVIQVALPIGTASFRIHSLDRRQFNAVDARDGAVSDPVYFEVDTPTVAVTFVKEGEYRINVREDGSTEVIVRQGQAEVYNQELGTIVVKKGRRAIIEDQGYYQITRLEQKDEWDRWNDRRDDDLFSRAGTSFSSRYVPVGIPGVYDLDLYGDWVESPDYGWVWSPRGVSRDWAPYRSGCWRWYPRYGWTWISHEPWGWAPYHYGRWTYWGSRWCWTPYVNLSLAFDWGWRPHLVTFFGWGRYGRGYRDGYRDAQWDYLGWCPLGPRDRYYGGNTTIVNNTRIINVQSLDNYNAPGGVSRLERGRFDNGRVVVTQEVLNAHAPPRPGAKAQDALPVIVRHEDVKPTQPMPSRNPLADRAEIARRIEAPIIARRPIERAPEGATHPTRDGRALPSAPERGGVAGSEAAGAAPTRKGISGRVTPSTDAPARGETTEGFAVPSRGQVERSERPSRAPEY